MDEEFLKNFPVKPHPDAKMTSEFVALFIAEEPQLFLQLQNLIREQKDLIEIMKKFDQFLTRKGFDRQYGTGLIFHALCNEARIEENWGQSIELHPCGETRKLGTGCC
jgi:hypothetical protein